MRKTTQKETGKTGTKPTKPNARKGGRPPRPWRPIFLGVLEVTANVSRACKAARINRWTAYEARKEEADFAAKWAEALEIGCDELEAEARRRAKDGVDEPVFYLGKQCGTIKRYSDQLMIVLLKAHRPEKYRERVSVDTCPELNDETMRLLTDDEVDQAAAGKLTAQQLSVIIVTRRAQQAAA